MKTITDFWLHQYLETIKSAYNHMVDDRTFTTLQRDKIKKTLQSLIDNLKKHEQNI